MSGHPEWLPELIEFEGDWPTILGRVYGQFCDDLVRETVVFKGRKVAVRKHPPFDGMEYGFWHCISEGRDEEQRIPDPERCKCIGWIRAIIEHVDDPEVEYWCEQRGNRRDHLLWFREEFVVVLSERGRAKTGGPEVYLLKTAFTTYLPHQKRKKRRARDASR